MQENYHRKVRIALAGLSHDHVFWLLRNLNHPDVEVVGIYEPNQALAENYAARFGFSMEMVHPGLDEMLEAVKPEAVAAFGPIYDHLRVVQACAPRGVHVMVEKPLAVSIDHASAMAELARKHEIALLTNFETSWYATTYEAYQRVITFNRVGEIRKVVVHDGHFGPKELGCTPAFLEWLTDPVMNGGGAIVDFGCYGANLIPWLMNGELPTTVTAVTQTLKPHIYHKVDDEATIILTYPHAQGIIQASWNWPVGRKDMEIYGESGYVIAEDRVNLRVRESDIEREQRITLDPLTDARADPFSYLAAVVDDEREQPVGCGPADLYSLEINLAAVRILDAARESARTGKTITLGKVTGKSL
jgi:predicted dehydrogenase